MVALDLEQASVDEVAAHLAAADAVVFAAGAGPGSGAARKETVDRDAAILLADAAEAAKVSRYVMISSMGADAEAPDDAGNPVFVAYLRAKGAADDNVRAAPVSIRLSSDLAISPTIRGQAASRLRAEPGAATSPAKMSRRYCSQFSIRRRRQVRPSRWSPVTLRSPRPSPHQAANEFGLGDVLDSDQSLRRAAYPVDRVDYTRGGGDAARVGGIEPDLIDPTPGRWFWSRALAGSWARSALSTSAPASASYCSELLLARKAFQAATSTLRSTIS